MMNVYRPENDRNKEIVRHIEQQIKLVKGDLEEATDRYLLEQ